MKIQRKGAKIQRTQRSTVFEIFLSLFARYPHNPLRSLRLRAFALDFMTL